MKEKINNTKDFLAVNKKGSSLIFALSLFHLLIVISFIFEMNLHFILMLKEYDAEYEAFETKIIQRIKSDFYHNETENFTYEEQDFYASVDYEEIQCIAEIKTSSFIRNIRILYDDVYLCIESIEYETLKLAY